MRYLYSLKPPAALPLLEALAGKDLNATLQGSQLLREVQQKSARNSEFVRTSHVAQSIRIDAGSRGRVVVVGQMH